MSNEIFDKDKENELIGKQKKHLNKKISILSGIIVLESRWNRRLTTR